jgi:integrase
MASIRKRTWRAGGELRSAWVADYLDQHGKRRLKTFRTKREADAWLVGARAQVAAGTHTADSASITVGEAAELWIERCEAEGLEPQTIRTYRNNAWHHVIPLIGHERLSRLTSPAVERYRDELLCSRSREMARKAMTTFKMIVGDAQRRGLVAQNVAASVRIRSSGRHKEPVAIPTKGEVKALLAAVAPRWRPLIVTAVFRGCEQASCARSPGATSISRRR